MNIHNGIMNIHDDIMFLMSYSGLFQMNKRKVVKLITYLFDRC